MKRFLLAILCLIPGTVWGSSIVNPPAAARAILPLPGGDTSYIQNTSSLQAARFNVSSGTLGIAYAGVGSAGSPSLSFSSDTTTGLFLPASNTLGFSVAGSTRAIILPSGFVGIGIDLPTGKLEVDDLNPALKVVSTIGRAGAIEIAMVQDESGLRTYGGYWTVGRNAVTDSNLRWVRRVNLADAVVYTIENGSGFTSFGGDIVNTGLGAAAAPLVAITTLGAESGTSTPNGGFALQASNNMMLSAGLNTTSNIYSWIQSRDSGAADFYNLSLNPSGGNVGIGIVSPGSLLEVNGTTKIDGAFTLGSTVNSNISFDNTTTHGIVGTTTNNNAAVGSVGEYRSATSGSTSAGTSAQFTNLVSTGITAGDWDVTGCVEFHLGTGVSLTEVFIAVSVNSGSTTTDQVAGLNQLEAAPPTATYNTSACIPSYRLSVSGNTTIYVKTQFNYSSGTPTIGGGSIHARRVR